MDMGNPHYILVQNFSRQSQEWLTHDNFAIGAIVDDPKNPKESAVVPGHIWGWDGDSLLKEGPFRGKIPISANDKQQVSNKPTSYAITELNGFFSRLTCAEEARMPDILETRYSAERFAQRLMDHHQTARFFYDFNYSTWKKIFPLYMVTGIKYANGLRYWIKRDRDWYDRGTLVDRTDWPAHEGWILDRKVGIAYRIHEINMDRRGTIRFDVYVDNKRATCCRHDKVLELGSFTRGNRS
uniref:Uncharacterized protein n=1 Tax=Bionectria ochroleuca TaxID=29856 RepID=A0A8H7K6E1_BIOOC